jgi:hypothetical protein
MGVWDSVEYAPILHASSTGRRVLARAWVGVKGGGDMSWERPSFVEIKMDSEINSYQDDFQNSPDWRENLEIEATPPISLPPHE